MACMRRMELADKDDSKEWNEMFNALDKFFDPLQTSWNREDAVKNGIDPVYISFAYEL